MSNAPFGALSGAYSTVLGPLKSSQVRLQAMVEMSSDAIPDAHISILMLMALAAPHAGACAWHDHSSYNDSIAVNR